jgi:hypothetical protein
MYNISLGGKFPWIHRHQCPKIYIDPAQGQQRAYDPVLVVLPDNRLGVINHLKTDGNFGVRPITDLGEFLPNPSGHWTDIARKAIPEEVSVAPSALRPLTRDEYPASFTHLSY